MKYRSAARRGGVRKHDPHPTHLTVRRLSLALSIGVLALSLFFPITSAADTPPTSPDPILGEWEWSNGAKITLIEDGTFRGQSAQGEVSGKWKLIDATQRQYKLLWRINNEAGGMDTVTLATDVRTITGQDPDGKVVSGKRPENKPLTGETTGNIGTDNGSEQPIRTFPPSGPVTGFPVLDFNLPVALRDGKIVVGSLENYPLAAVLSLKAGDKIVTINGKATNGMSLEQAQALLRGGNQIAFEILRAADNKRMSLALPQIATPGTGVSISISTSTLPARSKVSEANRKKADELWGKGLDFEDAEKWPQAVEQYRAALQLNPDLDECWIDLGEAYEKLKKWKEAEQAYRAAINLLPDESYYHAQLANALLEQGHRAEAEKEAREAIRLGLEDHLVFDELELTGAIAHAAIRR